MEEVDGGWILRFIAGEEGMPALYYDPSDRGRSPRHRGRATRRLSQLDAVPVDREPGSQRSNAAVEVWAWGRWPAPWDTWLPNLGLSMGE